MKIADEKWIKNLLDDERENLLDAKWKNRLDTGWKKLNAKWRWKISSTSVSRRKKTELVPTPIRF